MNSTDKLFAGSLLLVGLYALWGIGWGLPSAERNDLFLPAPRRSPEFYAQVEKSRDDLYAKMGDNALVYMGRLAAQGQPLPMLLGRPKPLR